MEQLNGLTGLKGVKREVNSLISQLKINGRREARGLKTVDVSNTSFSSANPGTGKTTVARILSKIYKQLGVLESGQLIEVDRGGLVAGYVGQTALKTKKQSIKPWKHHSSLMAYILLQKGTMISDGRLLILSKSDGRQSGSFRGHSCRLSGTDGSVFEIKSRTPIPIQ